MCHARAPVSTDEPVFLCHAFVKCQIRRISTKRIGNIAAIAQLGERQTEDLKVSIPGLGIYSVFVICVNFVSSKSMNNERAPSLRR